MPQEVLHHQLPFKILEILKDDLRTQNSMQSLLDAMQIHELPWARGEEPNWELWRWKSFNQLSPDLQAALSEAEVKAQKLYRISGHVLGSTTI